MEAKLKQKILLFHLKIQVNRVEAFTLATKDSIYVILKSFEPKQLVVLNLHKLMTIQTQFQLLDVHLIIVKMEINDVSQLLVEQHHSHFLTILFKT